jgi:hypothetical protein
MRICDLEARITCAYIADSVGELAAKLFGREALWGVEPGVLDGARGFTAGYRDPAFLAALAFEAGPRHLDDDYGALIHEAVAALAAEQRAYETAARG